MNYRHVYHAGNFADVLKHAILARIVTYMKTKDKAFRVLDTHAGRGRYDLTGDEAQRTGEWRQGIGRLMEATLSPESSDLFAPYLDDVRRLNPEGGLRHYPGSPRLVRDLLRRQDRLSAVELHPEDAAALHAEFEGDHQTRVIRLDGWLALGAHLPPKEKRGLVLVDPPFEETGEFDRMVDGLARATRRWRGGTYCLWYPLKKNARSDLFLRRIAALGLQDAICAELWTRPLETETALNGSGLVIVNPPYTLAGELEIMLPSLRQALCGEGGGTRHFRIGD